MPKGHAEAYPGLDLLDGLLRLVDEQRGIVPAPVRLVAEALCPAILGEGIVIRKRPPADRIRIEIVVEMDAVHVIARYDVAHDLQDVLARSGLPRVEIDLAGVFLEDVGVPAGYMAADQGLSGVERHAVGIEPRVQFHPAGMALLDHEAERIPERLRSLALRTGQITRPGLYVRYIESVGLRTYLEENGIATAHLKGIQRPCQPRTDLILTHLLEPVVADDMEPGAPELPEREFLRRRPQGQHDGK